MKIGILLIIFILMSPSIYGNGLNTKTNDIILNIPSEKYDKLSSELSFCAKESNSTIRLSCYEEASKNSGIPIYYANETNNNTWIQKSDEKDQDWMAVIGATNTGINGKKTYLNFRCIHGKTTLYLKYGSPVGTDDVYLNIGSSEESLGSYNMKPSSSGDALGLWDNNQAIIMSKYLSNNQDKIIIKTHFKDGTQTDLFYMSGGKAALTNVRRACEW